MPDLVKRLGGLYQSIESRLNSFEKLLKLQGRLDLVMSQIQLRHRARDDEEEQFAPVVYNEGEEDEMDTESGSEMEELDFASDEEALDGQESEASDSQESDSE